MRETMLAGFTWLLIMPSLALAQTPAAPSGDSASRDTGRWHVGFAFRF